MTDEANTCVEILKKAARFGVSDCQYCPAYIVCPTGTAGWNNECMLETAADLIESLSAELEQVMHERDAAVEDLKGTCTSCINYCASLLPYGCQGDMREECEKCPCTTCERGSNWQWRGAKEG